MSTPEQRKHWLIERLSVALSSLRTAEETLEQSEVYADTEQDTEETSALSERCTDLVIGVELVINRLKGEE